MPVNIVYDNPRRVFARRHFRQLFHFIGSLLVLVGLIGLVLLIVTLIALASSSRPLRPDASSETVLIFVVTVFALMAGRSLSRASRRPVLFLRRFGFAGALETLTYAIGTAVGSSWRLVTLDDHQVAAVGASRRARWSSLVGSMIGIGILAAMAVWLSGGGLSRIMGSVMGDVMGDASRSGNLLQALSGLLAAAVLALVVGVIVAAMMLLVAIFFGGLSLFSGGSYMSVRRAENSKTIEIAEEASIEPVSQSVFQRTRRVLGPRLVVVRVNPAVWQPAVRRLSSVCAAVIVDISQPSDNLLWELSTLKPSATVHWILVAHQDYIQQWTDTRLSNLHRKLLKLIDGEDVLAYGTDRAGKRRFTRVLRARLEDPVHAITSIR